MYTSINKLKRRSKTFFRRVGFLVTRKSKFDDFDYENVMDVRIDFFENKDRKAEENDILNHDIIHIKNENTHKKYDVTCIVRMLVLKKASLNGGKSLASANLLHCQ